MRAARPGDFHGQRVKDRRFHLRGHKALPDELVQPELVAVEVVFDLLRLAQRGRRADGFVRFLRVLRFALVHLWFVGQVIGAEARARVTLLSRFSWVARRRRSETRRRAVGCGGCERIDRVNVRYVCLLITGLCRKTRIEVDAVSGGADEETGE